MKRLILLMTGTLLMAQEGVHKDIEIAIHRFEAKACENAKAQAHKNYEILEISQCTCERTDSREWQCFVRFSYEKTAQPDQ